MGYYGNWLEFDEEKRSLFNLSFFLHFLSSSLISPLSFHYYETIPFRYEYVDKIFRINTYSYFQLALSFLPHLNQTNGRFGINNNNNNNIFS